MRRISKKALITGISGQDGSYLAELLLSKGYKVHGIVRRAAIGSDERRLWRIKHILPKITLHSGSMESYASIINIIKLLKPDEIYHLAAQSYVSYSFEDEFSTLKTNINGTHYVLSAIKEFSSHSKFYFAGSSEMFGKVAKSPQNENTPLHPRSAYGISKVTGFNLTRNYREAYNIHASTGILYNHESERRGHEFVTRKISLNAAKIKLGLSKFVELGNIDTKRDWGHAKEYVEAMWLMLQSDSPDDYVVGTGQTNSVKKFAQIAFGALDLNYKKYVKINKKFFRPTEVELLKADNKKFTNKFKWKHKIKFDELVTRMVMHDYNEIKKVM
tara:strand:+ start:410 stop:1399 length:990 start_codon:yes stop_codon:yes gene_type:complete